MTLERSPNKVSYSEVKTLREKMRPQRSKTETNSFMYLKNFNSQVPPLDQYNGYTYFLFLENRHLSLPVYHAKSSSEAVAS